MDGWMGDYEWRADMRPFLNKLIGKIYNYSPTNKNFEIINEELVKDVDALNAKDWSKGGKQW